MIVKLKLCSKPEKGKKTKQALRGLVLCESSEYTTRSVNLLKTVDQQLERKAQRCQAFKSLFFHCLIKDVFIYSACLSGLQ